ncbi:hypothetical protein TRFO_32505 [Tritrichomonas foetus]|uniref:Uncharacterized protein n=1 Tax=Tritrichomonas foetus TaxID=1144522 RepID=A0A1J4JT78_9EUKA|nr:hypothetical protein TRFO_32505 [Tritrichomonas foetus]|eukprot:OHT00726.1 hypothetical protein TRFO_32505 [Tritrichomonas foetus]
MDEDETACLTYLSLRDALTVQDPRVLKPKTPTSKPKNKRKNSTSSSSSNSSKSQKKIDKHRKSSKSDKVNQIGKTDKKHIKKHKSHSDISASSETSSETSNQANANYLQKNIKNMPFYEAFMNDFLVQLYQNRHPKIVKWVVDNSSNMVDLFFSNSQKEIHDRIMALFLSTNLALLDYFSNSVELVSKFADLIKKNNEIHWKRVGLVMTILLRALINFPNLASQTFLKAKNLYPNILKNIHLNSVMSYLNYFTETETLPDCSFVWGFFLSLIPAKIFKRLQNKLEPPSIWNVDYKSIKSCAEVKLTHEQQANLLIFMKKIIQRLIDEKRLQFPLTFSEVFPYLCNFNGKSDDEILALFSLSHLMPKNNQLISISAILIQDLPESSPLFEESIRYLSLFYYQSEKIMLLVLQRLILRPNNGFAMQMTLKLLYDYLNKVKVSSNFFRTLQHAVTYVWNSYGGCMPMPIMIRAFLINVAYLMNDGEKAAFPGWEKFINDVVTPFSESKAFPRDYKIDTTGCDISFEIKFEEMLRDFEAPQGRALRLKTHSSIPPQRFKEIRRSHSLFSLPDESKLFHK